MTVALVALAALDAASLIELGRLLIERGRRLAEQDPELQARRSLAPERLEEFAVMLVDGRRPTAEWWFRHGIRDESPRPWSTQQVTRITAAMVIEGGFPEDLAADACVGRAVAGGMREPIARLSAERGVEIARQQCNRMAS